MVVVARAGGGGGVQERGLYVCTLEGTRTRLCACMDYIHRVAGMQQKGIHSSKSENSSSLPMS